MYLPSTAAWIAWLLTRCALIWWDVPYGKFIFKELCAAAKAKNGGWVEYQWTKPGAGKTSRKLSYAATAELAFSTGVQIAAGVYDDAISVSDLNKMTSEMSDPSKYSY